MSILGNRVLRREDPKFLTVGGTYVDDVKHAGAVYVHFVRSTIADARITAIDVTDALDAPGVLAVYTGADVDLAPAGPAIPFLNAGMLRPWIATDKVRYVGEIVAVVVTEERYQGPDAAERVFVDYDALPAVVDLESAETATTMLFDDVGTNVALDLSGMTGFDPKDEFWDGCEVVVQVRAVNQRVAPCPLEVRAALSFWEGGRLTHYAATQNPNSVRDELAKEFGLEPADVRVIGPDVGGGFGAKSGLWGEDLLTAWAARKLERPARWVETRTESMVSLGHGRGQVQRIQIGGTRDGKVIAFRNDVLQDCGAYPMIGGFLAFFTRMMAPGTYDLARVEVGGKSLVTNTTPTVAYRGAGRPEATAAIERAMDVFAREIGMDPADIRRKNLVTKDRFPFITATGTTYDSGDYGQALELALEAADYKGLRAEQARRREAGEIKALGIGLSTYVEITNPLPGGEYGAVEVTPEGKAKLYAGTFSHGQGHATAFAMIAADRLGIPMDDIEFIQGDTDLIRFGQGTMGSRSLQTGGAAIAEASTEVVEQAKDIAANLLEAARDDIVLDIAGGQFHVAGAPAAGRSWAEVASAAQGGAGLRVDIDFMPKGPSFPFGAHVAVVEVDQETGKVELIKFVAVDDSGKILNPLIAEGQRHGGIGQGVGQALCEEFVYDDDGNPVTANLADYTFISAAELPSFDLVSMETPTPLNELGAKGIGESGTIGATPAVQNAVVDALAHLGVVHLDMPLTPQRVWKAIQEATA